MPWDDGPTGINPEHRGIADVLAQDFGPEEISHLWGIVKGIPGLPLRAGALA
jgi:hypothetical protein